MTKLYKPTNALPSDSHLLALNLGRILYCLPSLHMNNTMDKVTIHSPGWVIWFTGLPASGKTTLAQAVQHQLAQHGVQSVLLDSDELRRALTPQPTYSDSEREWFYGVMVYLAAWLARSGVNVLVAATANRRAYRQAAREQVVRFAEVYVQCALEVCRQRDPKAIYAQAAAGAAAHVPGVGARFEEPLQPEATVATDQLCPEEAANAVVTQLAGLL